MRKEVAAWEQDRNNRATPIDWRFTTEDPRIKLKRLYPKLLMIHDTSDKVRHRMNRGICPVFSDMGKLVNVGLVGKKASAG